MTEKQLPSRVRPISGSIAALNQRIFELERRLQKPTQTRLMPSLFSYPGALSANILSPAWYPEHAVTLNACRLSVPVVAGGTITVELRKNGSGIQQISLPPATLTSQVSINLGLNRGDFLTLYTVDNGGDGANLSVGFGVLYT